MPGETAFGQLQHFEELAQTRFLVSPQMPWLREHTLDHSFGLGPFAVQASTDEVMTGPRSRAMRGYDIGDYGSQLI